MRENEVLTGGEEGVASPGEGKEVRRGTGGRVIGRVRVSAVGGRGGG